MRRCVISFITWMMLSSGEQTTTAFAGHAEGLCFSEGRNDQFQNFGLRDHTSYTAYADRFSTGLRDRFSLSLVQPSLRR
jgi:hypothetical protein